MKQEIKNMLLKISKAGLIVHNQSCPKEWKQPLLLLFEFLWLYKNLGKIQWKDFVKILYLSIFVLKNIQFLKNPESSHKSPFEIFFPTLLSLGQLAPTRPRPLSPYRQPTTSFLDYRKCPNLVCTLI